jgi:uncharacterized membrane protein
MQSTNQTLQKAKDGFFLGASSLAKQINRLKRFFKLIGIQHNPTTALLSNFSSKVFRYQEPTASVKYEGGNEVLTLHPVTPETVSKFEKLWLHRTI